MKHVQSITTLLECISCPCLKHLLLFAFQVKTLREELTARGIDIDGMDREQCKKSLDDHLCGVKRPLALLCTNCLESLPRAHSQYTVAHLEILHHLKSIIGNNILTGEVFTIVRIGCQ